MFNNISWTSYKFPAVFFSLISNSKPSNTLCLQYLESCVHFIHQRHFTKLLPQQLLATGHEYGGDALLDHPQDHLLHHPVENSEALQIHCNTF